MDKDPLEVIRRLDPDFFDRIAQRREYAFSDGALPAKVKYLIAMSLDAAHGAAAGVEALAGQALQHGASKEEVLEALRVADFVSGVGSVYTASFGLDRVL